MKSSSLKMIDAGISNPREYRDALIHEWHLKEEYRRHLVVFMLRYTTPQSFFRFMKDGELTIARKSHSVTWINHPNIIRGADRILVSVRYCGMLDRGYVLVKKYDHDIDEIDFRNIQPLEFG